jgi:hypothetical protein
MLFRHRGADQREALEGVKLRLFFTSEEGFDFDFDFGLRNRMRLLISDQREA